MFPERGFNMGKGFVRILESIIASIILLTSMTFFLTPGILETGWDDAMTQMQSQDVLFTLNNNASVKEFIRLNDISSLNNKIGELFHGTIDFSIYVNGLPNPIINIGCNCSQADITNLETMLSPLTFNYTRRTIDIRISNETIMDIRSETDILFIFDYKNLSIYENELGAFFERGGTVFMLADLTEEQVNNVYMNSTFGLSWYDIGDPANNGIFFDTSSPDKTSYKIAKYFVNVSGLADTTAFAAFNRSSGINHIDIDDRTIINDTSNVFSFVKINDGVVDGNGRTIWFNDYNHVDVATNYLLKATVMWASGERYKMDTYDKTYPSTYTTTKYILFDEDPYDIELLVWRVFY